MNQREFHSKGKTVAKVINLCKMQVSFSVSPKLCTDFSGFLEVFLSHWLRLHFLHFSLKYCVDNEQKIEIIVSSALHDASAGHFTFYDLTVTFSFFFFFSLFLAQLGSCFVRSAALRAQWQSLIIAHLITKVVRLKFVIEVFFFWVIYLHYRLILDQVRRLHCEKSSAPK